MSEPQIAAPQIRHVLLSLIDDPALPSRTTMDEELLDELVASIRALGFISVVVLVVVGERFRVVAGHRRTMAARRAGLVSIPAIVYPSESAALDAIQHAENRNREALTVTDEAIWFQQLLEKYPAEGTDGLAARVGEKREYVEGRLALLHGCEHVFRALGDGAIKIGVAQQLNRVVDERHRLYLLDLAVRSGATVGLVTQWVHEWKTIHAPATGTAEPAPVVATGGPVLGNEYMRCKACGLTENVAHMQSLQIHDYCVRATLDPALRAFQNRADFIEWPRTRESAEELIARVLERFPELVPS